jgi:DNA polymerase
MNQSARSSVFLDEMGIGVQWKLRGGPETDADDGFVAAVQALADGAPERDVKPVAAAVVSAPAPVPAGPAAPSAPGAPTAATALQPVAPPPSVAPVTTMPVAVRPQEASAPAAASAATVAAPAPATPPGDDSNAWFDDAPAPARSAPVSDEAIASMDWDALKAAVSTCTRCPLCETRRAAVNGRGASNAKWIAIGSAPSRLDEKDVQAISGEAGQLLNNMLKAIDLQPESDVYVTNLVKCRPAAPDGGDRAPAAEELLACRPYLERELALTGASMAMTFGQHAAKGLMLGAAARGKVMHYGASQLPVVATYHPDDLLRKPEDKAKAWGDLCLAKASHA